MGQAGTQYRELAFSIGCPIKTKGEQALNKSQQYAADGRRTPFPWLLRRHSKVAAVLSVSGWGLGPFGCGVPVALVPGQVAKPAKLVSTKAVRICVRFGCFGNRWCW